jgi:predicted ATPase
MLIDYGSIARAGDQWVLSQHIHTAIIHESLQGLLMERIDRLPAEIRQTLRVSAVIGRRFTLSILEAVLSQPHLLVQQQLEYLQANGVIRMVRTGPEYDFACQNTLGQEAAYRSLLTSTANTCITRLVKHWRNYTLPRQQNMPLPWLTISARLRQPKKP